MTPSTNTTTTEISWAWDWVPAGDADREGWTGFMANLLDDWVGEQVEAVPMMSGGVAGVEANGLSIVVFGTIPFPVIEAGDDAERTVRLGVGRIEFKRA